MHVLDPLNSSLCKETPRRKIVLAILETNLACQKIETSSGCIQSYKAFLCFHLQLIVLKVSLGMEF